MISDPDRRKTVELIKEARKEGSRLASVCGEAGISVQTFRRWTAEGDVRSDGRPTAIRPEPFNKLAPEERQQILEICHQPENASLPPGQIVPRLADKGEYVASESSFYRVLHEAGEQNHRGRSRKPRKVQAPKGFCATGPNQVWSWDITWLAGPVAGMFFYLYMFVDIFSRKIVGWEVHDRETAELAATQIYKAILAEGCIHEPPVLHADNGGAQKGLTMKAKLEKLGVIASYSRPGISNDNPYSEALFRTVKYCPAYPSKGFVSIDEARQWTGGFVGWYNYEHLHSAIGFVTPEDRHSGNDREILENRKEIYRKAREKHPERWSREIRDWDYIDHVWLNPPGTTDHSAEQEQAV